MKADFSGTASEKARANMGWQSPSERKAARKIDRKVCCNCRLFFLKETPNREGGCSGNYLSYCGHPLASGKVGHATRDTASCNHWDMKL
jgi:hypothetical protein